MATVAAPTPQQVVNALGGGQELNAAPTTLNGGNFWVGTDGNVYVKSAGVQGANGAAADNLGASNPALLTDLKSYGATSINNPVASAATGGGGGSGSSSSSAGATLSPAEINAVLAQLAAQQQTEQNTFNAATATNAASDAQQAANEESDVQNNTGAKANAVQNAEQAAASGNQGLKAVLASLGALGGTGQILAGRAVADSANNNIGSADSTYQTNAEKIAQANDAYLSAKSLRDQALSTALATDKQGTANSLYQDLVNKAQNIGDVKTANTYLGKIIGTEAPVTPISAPQAIYNGADTAAYAPPSSVNVTSAATQPGTGASQTAAQNAVTPVNSALYVNKTT